MPLSDHVKRAVLEINEHVAEEQSTEQLRELVLAINTVLNAIEKRRAELEGRTPRAH